MQVEREPATCQRPPPRGRAPTQQLSGVVGIFLDRACDAANQARSASFASGVPQGADLRVDARSEENPTSRSEPTELDVTTLEGSARPSSILARSRGRARIDELIPKEDKNEARPD